MEKKVILVILAIPILFSALAAAATAANFGAGPANEGSASSPLSAPGGVGYGGNGTDYVYQAGTIPTALAIDAPARTTIYVGETLTASLRLVRTDTYAGIPHASIRGHFSQDGINWSEPGSLTTDENGHYSYTGTVPDNPGTYQGYLSYDGDYTYRGCVSPIYTVMVVSQASTLTLGPTPADSSPVASLRPADSSPVASLRPTDSSLSTTLQHTPVSSNATTNVSTSFTTSTDPSLSGSVLGNEMLGLVGLAGIAIAVVVVLKFGKTLVGT